MAQSGSRAFKKIVDYSPEELAASISDAVQHCGLFLDPAGNKLDFYKILNGIDAYIEKRARKNRI